MMITLSKQMDMDAFVEKHNDLESALRNQRSRCRPDMTSNQHLYINSSSLLKTYL